MNTTMGWRIKEIRNVLHMSQAEFAEALGVSSNVSVSRWEKDLVVPGLPTLMKMCELSKRDLVWLLGEDSTLAKTYAAIGEKGIKEISGVDVDEIARRVADLIEGRSKIKMPEKKLEPINRRDELAEYRISKRGKGVALPKWLNMACGAGCELERSPDLIYFEEIRNSNLLHSAVVRGNSMTQTLNPGDVVILEEFSGGPIVLEPRGDDPKNSYRMLHARIPADAICVVGLNGDAPTLKRIMYDFSRGVVDWRLMIVADNAIEWSPRSVSRNDEIKFYAKLIGIAAQ